MYLLNYALKLVFKQFFFALNLSLLFHLHRSQIFFSFVRLLVILNFRNYYIFSSSGGFAANANVRKNAISQSKY